MRTLTAGDGSWTGTNGFRLMPTDPVVEAPMSAEVARAAGGELLRLAYRWSHPDDGDQDGLLVLGGTDEPGAVVAFWGDSWHQHPVPRVLEGVLDGGVATVGYAYSGDCRWEIVLDTSGAEALALTMNNVVPASAASAEMTAGPYAAMSAVLRRAG